MPLAVSGSKGVGYEGEHPCSKVGRAEFCHTLYGTLIFFIFFRQKATVFFELCVYYYSRFFRRLFLYILPRICDVGLKYHLFTIASVIKPKAHGCKAFCPA